MSEPTLDRRLGIEEVLVDLVVFRIQLNQPGALLFPDDDVAITALRLGPNQNRNAVITTISTKCILNYQMLVKTNKFNFLKILKTH